MDIYNLTPISQIKDNLKEYCQINRKIINSIISHKYLMNLLMKKNFLNIKILLTQMSMQLKNQIKIFKLIILSKCKKPLKSILVGQNK